MPKTPTFQRLERTISLIARHPFYPGKDEVVLDCLDELETRFREGLLSQEQKSLLASMLTPEASHGPSGLDRPTRSGRSS